METTKQAHDAIQEHQVVIVTGLSGAGKTSVIRALEDFGFYCVDNLPVPLLSTFLRFAFMTPTNLLKVAIGIDARSQKFLKDFMHEIEALTQTLTSHNMLPPKIIFLTSSPDVIVKRFQETRRKHPLGRGITMRKAIEKEKRLLKPINKVADIVLDTDTLNIHALRKWVRTAFSHEKREMVVNLVSFGFKYGLPPESNLVFDVRFLPNPYFDADLKPLSGKDARIQTFLFDQEVVQSYWQHLETFLRFSLKKSYDEGRFFVTVAVGCTGGRHRSVAFVERLATLRWPGVVFVVNHRDVVNERGGKHESHHRAHSAHKGSKSSSV